jgi:hypothetical protein
MPLHFVLALLLAAGCMKQVQQAVAPEPEGGGTLTCAQIVEQCDANCGEPLCLHRCTSQGNPEGQGKHAALLDCGQRNSCTDEACMRASCPGEIEACVGPQPEQTPEQPATPPEQPPPAS